MDNAMISECCNRTSLGLALIKAEAQAAKTHLFALWDRMPGDKYGGTQSMVEYAKTRPQGVEIVPLDALLPQNPQPKTETRPTPGQQICAMLFADVAGFSKINEAQLPNFRKIYLEPLARLIESSQPSLLLEYNTWGDGLFCVFADMESAGRFALSMQEMIGSRNPAAYGLPASFGLRISLHAGPVYEINDPILKKPSHIGTHVNFAARIETKTPIGHVYCSQTFAAMATAEGAKGFECEYADEIQLPKTFGTHMVYVVRRKG
ncbi:MAG: adenylate/guanylate cyclase domain-containing protein [Saprospiraceae bacterium]|nr:adenylate/guanylate cyclase domain-containing protein [Saprospiraceae bacterium]